MVGFSTRRRFTTPTYCPMAGSVSLPDLIKAIRGQVRAPTLDAVSPTTLPHLRVIPVHPRDYRHGFRMPVFPCALHPSFIPPFAL